MKELKYYTPTEVRQMLKIEVHNRLEYVMKELDKLKRAIKKLEESLNEKEKL